MAQVPDKTEISWTGGGVFTVSELPEQGTNPAAVERFVAADKAVFLEYMAQLWDRSVSRDDIRTEDVPGSWFGE